MASTNRQYKDSEKFTFGGMVGIIVLILLMLLGGCTTTKKCCDKEHVITEWDGGRQINWYSTSKEE